MAQKNLRKIINRIRLRTWISLGLIIIVAPVIIGMVYGVFGALGGSDATMLLHWSFDEGVNNTCSGGTNDSCDASGNSYDGAFGGGTAAPTWQTEDKCVSGKCLYFDGANDTITLGSTVSGVQSVSFWVKPMTTTEQFLALNGSAYITSSSGAITATGFTSPTYYINGVETPTPTVSASYWTHVTVTTGTGISASAITVGNQSTNFGQQFLDEIKFFGSALSADQVKAEYAGGAAVFGSPDTGFLNQGLVGYWPLDEASGNASDASGNATTLTNVSTTAYTGAKFGTGIEPDGTADYLYAADNATLSVTGSLTLAAWITPDDVVGTENILAKWDGANESYRLTKEGANIRMYIDSDSNYQASTGTPISANTVQHVAGVYDSLSQTVKLYVNGEEVASSTTGTIPASIGDDAGRFHLGAEDSTTTAANFFDGHIDDARVYSRALTPAEVAALYDWAPGPVGYWPMDENSGTSTVYDRSGNSTNLTMLGTMTADDWVPGKFGSALDFDGSNDFLDSVSFDPNTLDMGTNNITVSAWVWRDTATTVDGILSKRNTGYGTTCGTATDTGYSFVIWNTNELSFSLCDGTNGWEMYSSPGVVGTGVWRHVAAVVDRTNISSSQLYVDGVAVSNTKINDGSNPPPTGSISNSTSLSIGIPTDGGSDNFDGRIDEVRVYNYARTPQQIIEDMNGGHPAGGSPIGSQVAHWNFDEQYGTTVNNKVAVNTFTETISGANWLTQGDCKINGCLDFDGTDDVLTITNANAIDFDAGLSSGFTFATWFWADSDGENDVGQIWQKGTNTYCRTDSESGGRVDVECNLDLATTDANVNVSSAVATGTWNHLAMTYDDASTITVYINGVQSGTNTGSGATAADTANLLIGGTTTANFDGRIDEFQIYSSALTAEQVPIIMNANASVNFGTGTDEKSTTYGGPGGNPPISWLNLDENTGTTANDKSGNGNGGTIYDNRPFVPGKFGSAVSFDGTETTGRTNDSHLAYSNNAFDSLTSHTLSVWIKSSDTGDDWQDFFGVLEASGFGSGQTLKYAYERSTNSINVWSSGCDGGTDVIGYASLPDSQTDWHHVAFTNDSNGNRMYIDGIQRTVTYTSGNSSTNCSFDDIDEGGTTQYTLGCWYVGADNCNDIEMYEGQMDEVKIFDYALTPAQVAYDYNRGAPLAWYKFDECTGTTIYNNAKNSNGQATGENGTLTLGASGTTSAGTCSTSGAWANGASGKYDASMDFDGTDDYIVATTTALFDALPRFSVAAWVYLDGWGGGNYGRIFDKGQNSGGYVGRGLFVCNDGGVNCNSQSLSFYQSFNTDTYSGWWSSPANSLSTGQWYHVAIAYDNTSTANDPVMYINGRSVTVTENSTPAAGTADDDADADLYIGNRYDTTRAFNGQIDDFRIYGYELSQAQVKKVMNEGSAVRFGD